MVPAWMNQCITESSCIVASYMVAVFPPHQQQSARSQMPQLAKRLQAKLVHNHIIIIVSLLYRGHIKGYDTFGNLVRLPRNQGKSLEIRKSGFTSEITICHQILFEIHVKS